MKLEKSAGRMLRPLAAVTAAILGTAIAMPASAQTARPSGWEFELTNYLWATGLKGDVKTPALPSSKVDVAFGDIFDALDFAWSGMYEARKGKLGLIADIQYYKLSMGGTTSKTGPLGNTLTTTADIGVKQTLLGFAGAYRVLEGNAPVDLMGGLRYTKLDVEATANFSAIGHTGGGTQGGSKSWYDPYIGARMVYPLSNKWALTGYADVGGFGVGSDFTYQVGAGAVYKYSDKYSLKFGYRLLGVDYDKDGFVYDMKSDGIFIGMGVKF
jgi:opacity protein-like surface antigen